MVVSAQSMEVMVRDRRDSLVGQTDVAVRVMVPRLMVEGGTVGATGGVRDQWLYAVTDLPLGRVVLVGEAFVAPGSSLVSRQSYGGSVEYKVTPRFSVTNRAIYYLNPDRSVQWLYSATAAYTKADFTLSGSTGRLTGSGVIGQIKLSHTSPIDETLLYYSNDMEIPDMPWSVWVVREAGLKERLHVTSRVDLVIGLAVGKVGRMDYASFMIGNKIAFR